MTIDIAKDIMRKEGWKGFYKGILPNIIRSLGGSLILVAYDEMQMHIVKTYY